ncbi:MAG: hypothetical protein AAFY02_05625 [Pseudomonadota bacterium]
MRLSEGLRLRPLPELDACLAYRREPPALLRLNLEAWALLEAVDETVEAPDQQRDLLALLAESGWDLSPDALSALLAPLAARGLVTGAWPPHAATSHPHDQRKG